MKNIGFIGIGVMGQSMAENLLKNGYNVSVHTRTKSKADRIVGLGAVWCDDIKSCVTNKDAVITIIGYPKDVEEVYFGENGVLDSAQSGTYLIDMTTTSPKLSIEIYEAAKAKGLYSLDAPVSGGDVGAKNATLSIMVGGDEEAFKKCSPLFECMGKTIIYEGKAGSGQHTKMANQIAIAGTVCGVAEAIAYATNKGLDMDKMLASISMGAAGSSQMSVNGPKMIEQDFKPGFFVKHFIKDMTIASEEASDGELYLNILNNALKMYKALEDKGYEDLGTQAIIKYYEK